MTAPDNSFDAWLDELLDTVFANGITRCQQYAEGKGANTLMSDTLYNAKQQILAKCQEREAAAVELELRDILIYNELTRIGKEDITKRIAALANKTAPTNQKAGEI
jgi:hypothetical protein